MRLPRKRRLSSRAPGLTAAALLVLALGLAGFFIVGHAVDEDRRATAQRQTESDAQQAGALLERAGSYAVGLATAMAGEPVANGRRFAALVGSATTTIGLADAMWVQRVSALGRPAYERLTGTPITRPPGGQPAPPAPSYLPATFVAGLPFRPGADLSGLRALARALRNPASVFAGTATSQETVAGEPGFFLVQEAQFGQGPENQGFLVVFVPAGWLSLSLNEAPGRTAISLEGSHLAGSIGMGPAASQTFYALTRRWRVYVAEEPSTTLQATLPWLALAWPPATALIVVLTGRGMLRRRRAEREVDDIFELSLDLLCTLGVDGYLKRVNPAFEQTLGYGPDELLARPLLEFVHPDDREAVSGSIDRLRSGEAEAFECRHIRADGAIRWLEWNMRPVPERGLAYGAAHDVSGTRMLLEEQAALHRVATLVALGGGAEELFSGVTAEVGRLLGADATRLLRYEPDGTATVVAAHGATDAEIGISAEPGSPASDVWRRVAEHARAAPGGRSSAGAHALTERLLAPGIEAAFAAPIVVSGHPWGVIVAKWKHARQAGPNTETRMGRFTELVGTAIANADSRAALAASRRRVVATADETRRRIERDLHDGAQQRLVQAIITLKLAQRELGEDPEAGAALVERALETTASANEELRELARGIHPAVLSRGGLTPALETIAQRSPIPVALEVRTEGRLPERTELTAYFVVSEALTNAAKHSNASAIRVTIETIGEHVRLSISDDGVGGADPARGSGLLGLKDRVEAAGGTLTVRSPPGKGTDVDVELPVSPR